MHSSSSLLDAPSTAEALGVHLALVSIQEAQDGVPDGGPACSAAAKTEEDCQLHLTDVVGAAIWHRLYCWSDISYANKHPPQSYAGHTTPNV